MGYVETFGIGIGEMNAVCKARGLPIPEYQSDKDVVRVIIRLPEKKSNLKSGR